MIFVPCKKIPYLDGLVNGLVNGQMRDFSIAFLVVPESALFREKKGLLNFIMWQLKHIIISQHPH